MNKKVAFIGHRNVSQMKLDNKLTETIENLINNGYNFFTMGTHGNFDKLALRCCRSLRSKYI